MCSGGFALLMESTVPGGPAFCAMYGSSEIGCGSSKTEGLKHYSRVSRLQYLRQGRSSNTQKPTRPNLFRVSKK
jgi:hypothetical protein